MTLCRIQLETMTQCHFIMKIKQIIYKLGSNN